MMRVAIRGIPMSSGGIVRRGTRDGMADQAMKRDGPAAGDDILLVPFTTYHRKWIAVRFSEL